MPGNEGFIRTPSECHRLKKLMNINDKSQTTSRRKDRPLGSSAFSAGWGRILGLALLLSAVPSFGGNKFSSDLPQRNSCRLVTVNVQYRQMPNDASLKSHGGTVRMKHRHTKAVTLTIPANKLAQLAADPNVSYITPDRPVSMTWTLPTEQFVTAVESDMAAAQYALDGTGIGVAVIDSGISNHPDLNDAYGNSRVVYSQSFVAGDSTTADLYGHGTHVAGLVGGTGASSGRAHGYPATYGGIAPNVNLINLRVLDQNGAGTDSQVIAAIEQAIALQSTYNIRVISMSLGRPVFESYPLDPVCQAVESAWQAGIVVVVAAGNRGRDNAMGTHGFATIGAPANDPAVLTVGATRTMGTATRD